MFYMILGPLLLMILLLFMMININIIRDKNVKERKTIWKKNVFNDKY